jgi:hypothetical protein
VAYRGVRGGLASPPPRNYEAEPNSKIRGKEIRNNPPPQQIPGNPPPPKKIPGYATDHAYEICV